MDDGASTGEGVGAAWVQDCLAARPRRPLEHARAVSACIVRTSYPCSVWPWRMSVTGQCVRAVNATLVASLQAGTE
eukprot:5244977-Prymnesium_polylepis.1